MNRPAPTTASQPRQDGRSDGEVRQAPDDENEDPNSRSGTDLSRDEEVDDDEAED
ncbi:hypothetical protein [Chitinolyticbacter meiyuanensis]|uniref:hypothetical protein n=1 Tax=Chitinolyticbacter meiyuanensis TaxID=682798 RepID=UPI001652A76F|nr:hypothetical protein [Chitinolyticbacter meiyuanensis]